MTSNIDSFDRIGLRRRRVLQGGVAAAGIAAIPSVLTPSTAAAGSATSGFLKRFAAPDATQRPRMRWWVPSDDLDTTVLREQVKALAAGGLGGAELINMGSGFGSAEWRSHTLAALKAARVENIGLDLTLGPRWPAAVPTINLNSNDSAQGIFWGVATVAAGETHDGVVPASVTAPATGVTEERLVAVIVARIADGSTAEATPVVLDPTTAEVITDQVDDDGVITWTAPAGVGTWQLLSFWQRAEGKQVNGWPVVNHFDRAGARAVTDYWEEHVLNTEMRRLLARGATNLFEDSIELEKATHWTDGLADVFLERRGYDVLPHLPVLMVRFQAIFDLRKVFAYPNGDDERIRNDYYDLLSELYAERHLRVLRDWAHGVGMGFRAQVAYGATLNLQLASSVPDIPETESLWFAEKVDAYRSMSAAAHVPGKNVISVETDVVVPPKVGDDGYAITFPGVLNLLHGNFAGYINQIVFHGYPYPTSDSAIWPGYSPFANVGGGIGESWGPRNPNWKHITDLTDYLGRIQTVLQQGRPEIDVAIYRHAYWDRGRDNWDIDGALLWNDPKLRSAGYSYEYLDHHLFDLPQTRVRNRRLAPTGPAYKALVLTDVAEVGQSEATREASNALTLARARQILHFAKAGLPVVIVGGAPTRTPFASDGDDDARVAQIMAEVISLRTTRQVSSEAKVPAALKALGVLPDAHFKNRADHVWTVHRRAGKADLYYLYNEGAESTEGGYESEPVTLELALSGAGVPYRLNAWTGATEPVADYRRRDGRVHIHVDLAAHEAVVLAIAPRGWAGKGAVARNVRPEPVSARKVRRWQLAVSSYEPGASADETTFRTIKTRIDGLKPWSEIADLDGVSGVGMYMSSFTLPRGWDKKRYGATVRLGTIANSARVWINGERLPAVDLVRGTTDARSILKAGRNTIKVEVTTTLGNRLRSLEGGSSRAVLVDGLLGIDGAVAIEPYRDAQL